MRVLSQTAISKNTTEDASLVLPRTNPVGVPRHCKLYRLIDNSVVGKATSCYYHKMKTRSAAGMSARTAIAVFDSDSDDDNRIVQNNRNVAQARPTAIVVVERPANYKNQALTLLKNEFPLLSVHAIVNAFAFNNSTFTPAFRALQEIQQTQASDPDNATARIRQKYPFLRHVNKVFIKTSRKGSPVTTNYNELLSQELDEIDEFNQKENRSLAGAVPTNAKHGTAKHEENDKNGNLKPAAVATVAAAQQQQEEDLCPIECQCCFGDYPFLEMCQCTEGHLFCVQCLEHHVNEQFHGKNSTTFHCMDSTGVEPCQGVFNRGQLDKLSEDFQRNYDVKVGRLQVEQALFEGCHSCPGCEYIGFSDDETIFVECPQCNLWYCKSCNESLNIHRNKTCETVKKEKEADKKTSATNQAAEAMTEAVVSDDSKCFTTQTFSVVDSQHYYINSHAGSEMPRVRPTMLQRRRMQQDDLPESKMPHGWS